MIADAYKWAIGEGKSQEIQLAIRIDRFGVQAVLGRQLYAYEVNRIEYAEMVVKTYFGMKNTDNAAKFADEHQYGLELLQFAEKLVQDGEYC